MGSCAGASDGFLSGAAAKEIPAVTNKRQAIVVRIGILYPVIVQIARDKGLKHRIGLKAYGGLKIRDARIILTKEEVCYD